MWKKSAWFYEPQFGRISLNISILDSVLKLKKFKHKCWIWTAELFQFVKYCRTLTVWHFRQLWPLSTNQIIRTILPRILIGLFQYVLWEFKTYWRNFIRIENRIAKGIWLKKKGGTLDYVSCFSYTSFVLTRFLSTLYQNLLNTAEASLFV